MGPGAHTLGIGRNRWIVQEPQNAIAQIDLVIKKVALKPQMVRNGAQHLAAQFIQGQVEPADIGLKALDLTGPEIGGHEAVKPMAFGQVAAHMPELFQVDMAGALGGFNTKGRIAARAAAARQAIAGLDLGRQGEEGLGARQSPLDKLGR